MDVDRPHFRTSSTGSSTAAATTTICFISRLSSSSSMKLTKSILSPARAVRDGGPLSLSSSVSRRLRTNGSLKAGQASPFFITTTGKKRGSALENPEPSSPKVTCIGQVRVKTKKKVKQSRSLSRRRSGDSFRKPEQSSADWTEDNGFSKQQRYSNPSAHYQPPPPPPQECLRHRNQRWVHLPVSICDALREFSCLFPCKSSCFSTSEREKDGKQNGCVFARWLVSVDDGGGGRRREIELVVGGEDEEQRMSSMRSSRRHVFEDIEVKDDRIEMKGQSSGGGEESARVSICIPPKNALLLMRCRSDPVKMAALANRFSSANGGNEDIEEEEEMVEVNQCFEERVGSKHEILLVEKDQVKLDEEVEQDEMRDCGKEIHEQELVADGEEMVEEKEREGLQKEIEVHAVEMAEEDDKEEEEEEEEIESNMDSFEALLDQENVENYEECCPVQENEEEEKNPVCRLSPSTESDEEDVASNGEAQPLPVEVAPVKEEAEETEKSINTEKNPIFVSDNEENQAPEETRVEEELTDRPAAASGMERSENQETVVGKDEEPKKEKGNPVLPECLLLMMCEPKLSMEVSKETWVCSTDFVRWLPERPAKPAKAPKPGGCEQEPVKRRLSTDSKPKPIPRAPRIERKDELLQPPRSSCSLPAAAASMATVIEQKLVNAVGYEPFVLTRCKSEPMRTAAAKLMPESCFWKNAMRKLEPQTRTTIGVGAAGVGF